MKKNPYAPAIAGPNGTMKPHASVYSWSRANKADAIMNPSDNPVRRHVDTQINTFLFIDAPYYIPISSSTARTTPTLFDNLAVRTASRTSWVLPTSLIAISAAMSVVTPS